MTRRTSITVLLVLLVTGAALSQPMGGSYTIMPSGGDFTSFGTACAALLSRGYTRSCTLWAYTGTYTTWGNAMNFTSDSVWVVFKAAPGNRPVQTFAGYGFNITGSDKLVFDSIWFSTGNHCIYGPTMKKMVMRNCSLVTSGSNNGYGVSLSNADSCRFENNVNNGYYGFGLTGGSDDNVFIGNKIVARNAYGLYFSGTTYNKRNTFINNFVAGYTTRGWSGSYDSLTRFYFNSFYSSGAQPDLYLNYSYGLRAVDNSFYGGSSHCIYVSSGSIDTSNYNCFYTSGSYVAYFGGDRTWSAWLGLGYDANGINRDPRYVGPPTNLHIQDTSACASAGTPYGGVAYDIDGASRHPTAPCIGADEIGPVDIDDVGCTHLLVPAGIVDSGVPVTPACSVRNYGSTTPSYMVRMRIGAGYDDSAQVTSHPTGSALYVTFPSWVPGARGTYSAACSTRLTGDRNAANNRDTASGTIRVRDVAAMLLGVPIPGGSYGVGTIITPRGTWRNYGTVTAAFEAWILLDDPTDVRRYARKVDVPSLGVGGSLLVTAFGPCTLSTSGLWTAKCSTGYTGDLVTQNDTLIRTFTVGTVDVGVTVINAPTGSHDTGYVVVPQGTVRNFGDTPASFSVFFKIDSAGTTIYNNTKPVTALVPGVPLAVVFDTWPKPHALGSYTTRCSTYVAGDANPSNNALGGSFAISPSAPPPGGWYAKTPMPLPPSGKPMKDGAWLAYNVPSGLVYAGKGNKVGDFYSWMPDSDRWVQRATIPNGIEAKPPSKGTVGCSDSTVLFMVKGNNTQGFWKYDIALDSWRQMANVPLGTSNKKVKGGDDVAFVYKDGRKYVYLLKGYKNEFMRYDVALDSWRQLPNAPGATIKWDKGSWLAYDGTATIYAHKAKYHEFYKFDVGGDTWYSTALKGMPFISRTGKSKKSKDGGSGAWAHNGIYAFKGGNTQEFWKYLAAGDSWAELETIPVMAPGSTKKKKVKGGGDLTSIPPEGDQGVPVNIPAVKGNGCSELWVYTGESHVLFALPPRDGVMSSTLRRMTLAGFTLTPNPLSGGFVNLSYSLVHAGPVSVGVYDAAGRCVLTRTVVARATGSSSLDLRSLATGVYLVRLSSDGCTTTRKLVVER